jgi:hypothetical protein
MLASLIRRLMGLPQFVLCGVESIAQRVGSAALAVPARLRPLHTAALRSKVR